MWAHCDTACIIGLDGGAPWTTAAHACALKLDATEGSKIASCFIVSLIHFWLFPLFP